MFCHFAAYFKPLTDDLELIPADSRVEIDAKIHSGYFTNGKQFTEEDLKHVKGRGWECWEDVTVSLFIPQILRAILLTLF